ncbi:hypothetical protein OAA45_01225, partial [bacterium]|nr:hypothetical protein [bacterium]
MKTPAAVSILIVAVVVAGVGYYLFFGATRQSSPAVVDSPLEKVPSPAVDPPVVVEVPDPEPLPEPLPEPEPEPVPEPISVPDRYAMQVIASADGRELEAQILDVAAKTAFIRREDKIIFEIPLDRLSASSL